MDYLSEVERLLDMPADGKREVMRELRSHYQETLDKLMAAGMDPAQAEEEAAKQLGAPEETALRLNPVHSGPSLWSVILPLVPFLMVAAARRGGLMAVLTGKAPAEARAIFIYTAVVAGVLALAAAYAFIVVRELAAGRRPMWLATWLAAALGFGQVTLIVIAHLFPAMERCLSSLGFWFLLGPPLVVLPVCWKSPKWRTAAVVVCAAIVGCYATVVGFPKLMYGAAGITLYLLCFFFAPFAAWIMVSVRTFGTHKFGHPVLASLFLYTFFLIDVPLYFIMATPEGYLAKWEVMGCAEPEMLLAAAAVLAFGLTESWTAQLGLLICGIFAWGFPVSLSKSYGNLDALLIYIYVAVVALTVVLVPLVMMRGGRANWPEAVR